MEQKLKPIKIEIPSPLIQLSLDAMTELKKRGADIKPEDLFATVFRTLDIDYFNDQVEKLTPETYLFEEAKNDPEIMAILSLTAKRLMEAKRVGKPFPSKRGRKPSSEKLEQA